MSPGDYVKLDGGFEGFVVDITWRNTTIRDLSDNLIVVPNDKLGATIFTNFSVPNHRMTVMRGGVDRIRRGPCQGATDRPGGCAFGYP